MAAVAARQQSAAPSKQRRTAPALRVVQGRSRWPAVILGSLLFLLMAAGLGAAVFHTQLAERQLRIDQLERQVAAERDRFDQLRNTRASLRSPQRIAEAATDLGMVGGDNNRFIRIDPQALAVQIAAAGVTDDDVSRVIVELGPLDQFRDVKAVSAGEL